MANDPRESAIRACKAMGGISSKDGSECFMRGNICEADIGTKVGQGCVLPMEKIRHLINNG